MGSLTHLAIIMDGNGRWAERRSLPRSAGHLEGGKAALKVIRGCLSHGIGYLTLYCFSTENWNRPVEEVNALMSLMVLAIHRETPLLMENNVRLSAIGDLSRLPEDAYSALKECMALTAGNTGTRMTLAISYSSRWELTEAVRHLAQEAIEGHLKPEEITETTISDALTTRDMPDLDLMIRTGGEKRISNFLLWQASYAELYFTDIYWPDFREEELYGAILYYQRRERRFGKTSEQLIL